MRLATILPRASLEPVPVAGAPDGTWIELAGLIGREAPRMKPTLPWLMAHDRPSPERIAAWKGPRYRESEFAYLPPVVRPPAFRDFDASGAPHQVNDEPAFYFSNPTTLVGHRASVHAPAGCHELDFELELGVVIGHGGVDIPRARAWEHVFGFTILNDLSARDVERRELAAGCGPAKSKDFATAVGPWLVSRNVFHDRIDGETLTLELCGRVNGHEVSRGNLAQLRHSIPRMIERASRDAELLPGDLIGTGTVGVGCLRDHGAGRNDGWLKPGDVVELEVERIGILKTSIVARPAP